MINLKTAAKMAMWGCIATSAFSVAMIIWSIKDGNMIGVGISLICLGVMIACAIINYQNIQRLS